MKKQIKKTAVMAMAALALSTGGAITKGITAEAATSYSRNIKVDVPVGSNIMQGYTGYKVTLHQSVGGSSAKIMEVSSIKDYTQKYKISVSGTSKMYAKVCFKSIATGNYSESNCVTTNTFTINEKTFKPINSSLTIKVEKSGSVGKKATAILS